MTHPPSFEKNESILNSQAPHNRSPLRTLILLLLFTAALLVFIAWLGDWRRRHNIDTLMNTQVQAYSLLTTEGGLLPLNLQPTLSLDPPSRIIDAWLSSEEVRVLRGTDREVMVAWTIPLVRALGRNERAVIFFDHGKFDVRWLPLTQFDALFAEQIAQIKRLGS